MDINRPLEVPVREIQNRTKTNLGPRFYPKYIPLLHILLSVEDIVIRSILSTKETLQSQWKTVVFKKK